MYKLSGNVEYKGMTHLFMSMKSGAVLMFSMTGQSGAHVMSDVGETTSCAALDDKF